MNYDDFLKFCRERSWLINENNGRNAVVVFHCGERGTFCFPSGIPNCRILLPASWREKLGKRYSFNRLQNGNDILWPVERLDELLNFIIEEDNSSLAAREDEKKSQVRKNWNQKKAELLNLSSTERVREISGRVGQDILRNILLMTYGGCQITGISQPELLVASHIKPWNECDNDPRERLNENNVLLLSVALDKLFDRHFISFDAETGKMLVSDEINRETLRKLGVVPEEMTLKIANSEQADFLRYHNQKLRKTSEVVEG